MTETSGHTAPSPQADMQLLPKHQSAVGSEEAGRTRSSAKANLCTRMKRCRTSMSSLDDEAATATNATRRAMRLATASCGVYCDALRVRKLVRSASPGAPSDKKGGTVTDVPFLTMQAGTRLSPQSSPPTVFVGDDDPIVHSNDRGFFDCTVRHITYQVAYIPAPPPKRLTLTELGEALETGQNGILCRLPSKFLTRFARDTDCVKLDINTRLQGFASNLAEGEPSDLYGCLDGLKFLTFWVRDFSSSADQVEEISGQGEILLPSYLPYFLQSCGLCTNHTLPPAPHPHLLSREKLLKGAEARQDCLFGRHASKDQTAFVRNRDRVELYFLAGLEVLASDLANRQFSDLDSCLQVVELLAIDVVDLVISREQIEKIERHQFLPRVIEAENVLCEREFLTEAYTTTAQAQPLPPAAERDVRAKVEAVARARSAAVNTVDEQRGNGGRHEHDD